MERLLTIREVSDLLAVKRSTLYRWTHMDFIPHIKLGGKFVRFREADVLRWLEKKSQAGRLQKQITLPKDTY